jgi:ketosteroid isomerase-like protein
MIAPKVQHHGDAAVLSYNLRSEAVQPGGSEITIRWNSTSVYARVGGAWKMIHSHWSLTNAPATMGIV